MHSFFFSPTKLCGNSVSAVLAWMTNVKIQLQRKSANVSVLVTAFPLFSIKPVTLLPLFFLFLSASALRAKPSSAHPETERNPAPQGAAIGQRSGNAPARSAGAGVRKQNKRKLGDSEQHGGGENQPPQKKQPVKPGSKAQTRKKLIAGQGKLTSFFRV